MPRRISDLTSSEPPSSSGPGLPLFGPDDDDAIPGELILTLEPEAAAELGSIPALPQHLRAATLEVLAASSPLREALEELGVTSVAHVHGPTPTVQIEGMVAADDLGLDTTLLVTFEDAASPQDAADRMSRLDAVSWAEPNRWRQADAVPNDPRYTTQWGLPRIQAEAAWDLETGDPSIIVAVIDSGVDLHHPDLGPLLVAGRDFINFAATAVPKPGWVFEGDFTTVDNDAQDEVGHGTHVAGTICSLSNNGVGVAGVAWDVRLMPLRVLARIRETATGRVSGVGSSADTAAAIRWAADHGARVINLSLGSYSSTTVEREAVAYAISRDVVVVAAMGNDNSSAQHYPAAYPDVIAVAATDRADRRSVWSAGQASNTGAWVDLAAPGTDIVSTYWSHTYRSSSGTSMAAPHVAGAAALILSRNPALTAAEVGNILRTTARPLRDDPADPVPNDRYGHGLLQLNAALRAARPPLNLSLAITCPSRVIVCKSLLVSSCPPKSLALQCASVAVRCPTTTVNECLTPSRPVRCASSPILCDVQPSVALSCPSTITCPSRAVCPSLAGCPSLVCGPPFGGGTGAADGESLSDSWSDYDPYGFDPYGPSY